VCSHFAAILRWLRLPFVCVEGNLPLPKLLYSAMLASKTTGIRECRRKQVNPAMNKSSAIIIAATLGTAVPAHAGIISLNSPFDPGPTFTPLTGDQVEVTSPGWGGIIAGYETDGLNNNNAGTGSFGSLNFTGQLTSNNDYVGTATESFSFNSTSDPTRIEALTATVTWNTAHFVNDGINDVLPMLAGTGIVLGSSSSSGNDPFTTDFPVHGTFTITADFLATCDRFIPSCAPNQIIDTFLLNGALTPVPSPPIGQGRLTALLSLGLLFIGRHRWVRSERLNLRLLVDDRQHQAVGWRVERPANVI
jgi:hypothetical protein